MDKKKNPIVEKEFKSFIKNVKKKFEVDKAILFGSRARGDSRIYSDYDIILVSEKFKNHKWHKRIEKVVELWNLDKDIDILPYTLEEFSRKSKERCIVKEAVKEGISL